MADVKELQGQIITKIDKIDNEELIFHTQEGSIYKMYHEQDCCESVYIEDIEGDLDYLINTPIISAEESSNQEQNVKYGDSETWTFYRFATAKGYVVIRWYGTSNGYYSESVYFKKLKN